MSRAGEIADRLGTVLISVSHHKVVDIRHQFVAEAHFNYRRVADTKGRGREWVSKCNGTSTVASHHNLQNLDSRKETVRFR